ncbi:RRQRL motif-containing zinc-binding protein [Streptomyces sp. NPDC052196]|uniref:RRQRL motif-containing zinc-binding protein n=1 Tax=Streptomyces sp. NPDC052196 TaxID=3156691 RepID=UPI00343A2019
MSVRSRLEAVVVDVDPYATGPSAIIDTFDWQASPDGLATRRQLRALGLRPGGHDPVAQLRCRACRTKPARTCTRMANLYRIDLALPVRPMTLAKEAALDRAMAKRSTSEVPPKVPPLSAAPHDRFVPGVPRRDPRRPDQLHRTPSRPRPRSLNHPSHTSARDRRCHGGPGHFHPVSETRRKHPV